MKKIRRLNKNDRKFLGVCGGMSKYIDPELDPILARVVCVTLALICPPGMILLYLGLAIFLKAEDEEDLKKGPTLLKD